MRRMLMTLVLLGMSVPARAQKLESCHCYCGKSVRAPCGDEDCKRACGYKEPEFNPGQLEDMPSTLPFNVQKYTTAKEAYDKGDFEAAFREVQHAVNADKCYAPARALMGELLIGHYRNTMCTSGGESVSCAEVGAFELMYAAAGAPGCGRMTGMSPVESAQLEARAEPLYNAAHDARNRREGKRDLVACESLLKQGDASAAEQKCRNAVQSYRLTQPTKEDFDYSVAFDNLAISLEAQGRIDAAIDALEGAQKTPNGSFYRATPLGTIRQEKIERLKRKAGYCQLVMQNNTYGTLDLYINDSNVPACQALGQPKPPPGYNGPMASPPYPTFCVTHVREATYVASAKAPGAEFFMKASGPIWCPKGEVKYWTVDP